MDRITGLLARIGLGRPELRAWAMYDWANSAFWCTVIVAVFPPFFSEYAAAGLDPTTATSRFAWATTIAVTIVALMAPILGAVADHRALKKKMLAVFVAIGVIATLLMATIGRGQWLYALALFAIGNIGVASTLVFYDSLLPHIAAPEDLDRVSTAGYAIGFIGGGVLLLINLAWILRPSLFGLPDVVAGLKLSLASVGVWWLLFSIPLFRRVPEPAVRLGNLGNSIGAQIRGGVVAAWKTLHDLRRSRHAFLMLIAFLLYNDGIQTIIRMSSIYGIEIGIDRNAQIAAFIIVQFVGVPCSFAFGAVAGHLGAKISLFGALSVYVCISVLAYFMTETWQFFALAFLVGLVQGGSQALSRSLFARMIPKHKSSEYFGFFAVFEKFAGIAGPAVFAASTDLFGSSRVAVLSVIVFFVLGAAVLTQVDVAAGEAQAASAEAGL
jgi:UMF1 family MFS transporter